MNIHNDRKNRYARDSRCKNIIAAEEIKKHAKSRKNVKPVKGPRIEFLSYIKDEKMKIDDAIEKFLNKYNGYKREILITWIREELNKSGFESSELEELKRYLENYEKNIIYDGR